jgi:hypothetical protein
MCSRSGPRSEAARAATAGGRKYVQVRRARIRIPWRHVEPFEFRRERHVPREIGHEVGAIPAIARVIRGAVLRNALRHAGCVRRSSH